MYWRQTIVSNRKYGDSLLSFPLSASLWNGEEGVRLETFFSLEIPADGWVLVLTETPWLCPPNGYRTV